MNMTQRILNASHQFNRQARLFFLVIVGLGFAIDGVYTVIMNLYLLRLDYGTDFIGLVNAVGLLAFAMTSLPAGIMGARWSNTRMLKLGVSILCLGSLLFPAAEFVPLAIRDMWFVVTYAMMLAGFSFFFVNGEPYLINVVDSKRRNDAFAVKTAVLSLAAFMGSLVGGAVPELLVSLQGLTLDDPAPYRITLMIVSVVLCIAFLIALTITAPPEDVDDTPTIHYKSSGKQSTNTPQWTTTVIILIGVMTLVRLLQVAGSATVTVYFNVYMDTQLEMSTGVIGMITAVARLLGVPTALMVPALVRRWGNVNVIIWGSIATAACLLPLALFENWIAAAIGFIGVLGMASIRYTAFIVYILELVPKVQQSVMSGSGEMAGGLSFSMMALGGGIILSLFTFRDLFLVGSGLTLLGTIVFWLHLKLSTNKRKITPVMQTQ